MKTIPAILEIIDAKLKEYARIEALGPATEAEIAKLLEGSALDDPKVSARLSELRTRVELCPVKLRQLDAEIAALQQELIPAIESTARLLNQIAGREEGEQRRKILAALRELLPDLRADDPLVDQVFLATPAYKNRVSNLQVSSSTYGAPENKARELLAIARKQNVDIASEMPEPPAIDPAPEMQGIAPRRDGEGDKRAGAERRFPNRIIAPANIAEVVGAES